MPFSFVLTRSARRKKSMSLHLASDGTVRVRAPLRTPLFWVKAFVARHEPWIAAGLKKRRAAGQPASLREGDTFPFQGQTVRLAITKDKEGLRDGTLWLNATGNEGLGDALRLWARSLARHDLPARCALLSQKTGLQPSCVVLADAEKRWGSCSAANVVRLNWRLVLLPQELADYVILHELAHIRYKNHGHAYWAFMKTLLPDCREKRTQLRASEKLLAPTLALLEKGR